jgi:hypothetical protein
VTQSSMRTRIVAIVQMVLIFPAVLFMSALVIRNLQRLQFEAARSAEQLVMWYAGRAWTLWLLLLALPLAVLVSGCATLIDSWKRYVVVPHSISQSLIIVRSHLAALFVALITVTAGVILAIVVAHMLAN